MIDVRGAGERVRVSAVRGIRSAFSRRAVPAWITAGALAIIAAVLVAVGAFDTIESTPQTVAIGEEVRLPTYAVTVLDVEVTDAVEEQFFDADDGESLLLVTMRLENLSDSTIGIDTTSDRISSRLVNATTPLLELTGVTETGNARVWHDITSASRVLLQPDVPADITVGWAVPTADLDAGGIGLDVHEAIVRTGQIILASNVVTWGQGDLVARVDLGVGG